MDLSPELEPIYANLVRISHSPLEFVMDFARILPGQTTSQVLARLLMSPIGAKMFLRALTENLSRYEASFGEINLPEGHSLAQDLFRPINPPDQPTPPKE
jgi:hypothetical protein